MREHTYHQHWKRTPCRQSVLIESVAFLFLVACEVTNANACACVYSAGTVAHTVTSRASSASKIRKSTLPTAAQWLFVIDPRPFYEKPMNNKNRFRHTFVPAVHRFKCQIVRVTPSMQTHRKRAHSEHNHRSAFIHHSHREERFSHYIIFLSSFSVLFVEHTNGTRTSHNSVNRRRNQFTNKTTKNTKLNICDRNLYCVNFFRIKLYTPPR